MVEFHKDGTLPQNGEVFVFGSNLSGIHGAGAAKVARDQFGAQYGLGFGPFDRTFAIPTKDWQIETLDLPIIAGFVQSFCLYTKTSSDKFFVTRVGCGLAGYKDEQIAVMFLGAKNCSFPEEWRQWLDG
jgi:hypothetical protein